MSDRKYKLVYVVTRRNLNDNSSIACAVFHNSDEAEDTMDAYNQEFKDRGIEEYTFEMSATALFDE
jgi:hypothetical protein